MDNDSKTVTYVMDNDASNKTVTYVMDKDTYSKTVTYVKDNDTARQSHTFVTDVGVRNVVQALKKTREDIFLCDTHTGNPVVLYCKSCEVKLCHVCSGVDHRGCEGVVSLQSVAAEERKHVTGLLVKLKTKTGSLEKQSEGLKHETEMLKKRRHEEIEAASERFGKVRQILSRREEQLINEIEKEFGKTKKGYQLLVESLRDEIRATTEAEKYIENSLPKSDIQLFNQNCQRRCRPIAFKMDKTSDISFDKKVKSLMKQTKLSDIELLLTQQESVPPTASPSISKKRTYPWSPNSSPS
ncbi:putative tripartite motif-containing protein 75 [Haliotis rubra]|uniref:putative tripartite motif-containing protein 75 n=1 Tax=Haliotis rubra TaxID=36100 RepID=UPI001EE549E6|nr:putative tripartite motif-containing protein 75 [Haliotis rubra]